jgi:hypothetical protein
MITPFDEGFKAASENKTKYDNPYKSPNAPKTDDVKSDAWIRGFEDRLYHYHRGVEL